MRHRRTGVKVKDTTTQQQIIQQKTIIEEEPPLSREEVNAIMSTFRPMMDLLIHNDDACVHFLMSISSIVNVTVRENLLSSFLELMSSQTQNMTTITHNFIAFDHSKPGHIKHLNLDKLSKLLDGSDTPTQRLLKVLNRIYGYSYLEMVFDGVLSNTLGQDEGSTEVSDLVLQLTERLVLNIQSSADKVPLYLRNICVQIANQGPTEQAYLHNISSTIFRNFICPAIVLPEKFNIWKGENPPTAMQRQILLASSKLFLQLLPTQQESISTTKLATTVLDNDSEFAMYTTKAIRFQEHHRPMIREFLIEISRKVKNTVHQFNNNNNKPIASKVFSPSDILKFHKMLYEYFTIFPVLDPIESFSEYSHIRRTQEIRTQIKNSKSRDQYVQCAQRAGKICVPLSWVKSLLRPTEDLNCVTTEYDAMTSKQFMKDLQRDSIVVNGKKFTNCSEPWTVVTYMMECFGNNGMTASEKAHAAINILQKTGRTSGGGDSFDATLVIFGASDAAIVTPDSFSMNDHPHTIQISRQGKPIETVRIETSQVNFYKITDAKTYHEEHSVWFKVKTTVRWSFILTTLSDNIVDIGKIIIEPDPASMESSFKIISSSPVDRNGNVKQVTYLQQLQSVLYKAYLQERERTRRSQFNTFISDHLNK
jgi:hypothetical protein